MDKKGGVIILLLIIVFSSFLTSADVFLSRQPENVYSIGDTLSVVLGSDGSEGWAGVDLSCSNQTKMLYFHYLTSDETSASISVPLTKEFLRGMIGSCYLSVNFNGQTKSSFPFSISNKIEATATLSGRNFMPDETITFSGTGKKANGKTMNGFAELKLSGIDLEKIVPLTNDQFSGELKLPPNIGSGDYELIISVYDKDNNDEIINSGVISDSITISQKPTKLVLETPESFYPGNESSFKSALYDQTNKIIETAPVSYEFSDVNGKEMLSKLSSTGEIIYFTPEKNAPFGYWNLTANSNGIIDQKQIYIEKNMEAVFELLNGTLVVRNIGNVPYNKTIEITIGNETRVKHLNLEPGDSVHFELTAPDGEYSIKISDGERSGLWKGVSLTGAVVSLDGSGKKSSLAFFNRNWIAWLFIIGVLGMFLFVVSRRIINKNVFVSSKNAPKNPAKTEENKGGVVKITPGKDNAPIVEADSGLAQHSTVIDGSKQLSTLIAIKLKNYQEIKDTKSSANDTLKGVIEEIKSVHGKIYRNEDFIIGIFAPIATRTFENDITGIKCAKEILRKLNDHNRKFSQKIEFGISVNTGDIIAKKDSGKLMFTAIGTTLSNSKKIADIAKNNILLSEETHKRVMSQVKTTQNTESGALKTYIINEVVDRQSNSKFIESFLQRNQEFKVLRDVKLGRLDRDNSDLSPKEENKNKGFDINEWKK